MGIEEPQAIEMDKIISEMNLVIDLIKNNGNKMNTKIEFQVQRIYHDFWITQVPDKKLLADFYFAVGLGYQFVMGNENKLEALKYFQDAEGIIEELKNFNRLFEVYNELGIAFYSLQKFDLANLYYNKAYELTEDQDLDDNKKSSILVNLATINQKIQNYNEAIIQLKESIKLILDDTIIEYPEESKIYLGKVYFNIAANYLHLLDFENALEYYKLGNQYVEYPQKLKIDIESRISMIIKDIEEYDSELVELIIYEITGNKRIK